MTDKKLTKLQLEDWIFGRKKTSGRRDMDETDLPRTKTGPIVNSSDIVEPGRSMPDRPTDDDFIDRETREYLPEKKKLYKH